MKLIISVSHSSSRIYTRRTNDKTNYLFGRIIHLSYVYMISKKSCVPSKVVHVPTHHCAKKGVDAAMISGFRHAAASQRTRWR